MKVLYVTGLFFSFYVYANDLNTFTQVNKHEVNPVTFQRDMFINTNMKQ